MVDKIQYAGAASPLTAMTKQEFFALAEDRRRKGAGSGFAEWGKQPSTPSGGLVFEGLHCTTGTPNVISMGRDFTDAVGISRTITAQAVVNGIQSNLFGVRSANGQSNIYFPDAPDGTKTYDSATGTVVQHVDSATAFAAETATNKVVTSRQDFVFLEVWHEDIEDKDVVYPRGNVQNQVPTYEGIAQPFVINGAPSGSVPGFTDAQGYSAFGEWDIATNGRAMRWSTLTDAEKTLVLQDPENNIYSDGDKLIQVRYRVRVVEGLGDNWQAVSPDTAVVSAMAYDTTNNRIKLRGSVTTVPSTEMASGNADIYVTKTSALTQVGEQNGLWQGRADSSAPFGHEGKIFAIPIALVQRRNQGAYHPVYNPEGANAFAEIDGGFQTYSWYSSLAWEPNSTLECFTQKTSNFNGGSIAGVSGRSDNKKYDAIYASDVQDLRMSSRRRPLAEIREDAKRKAIAGEIRGFENVPFTTVTPITDNTLPSNSYFTVPTSISDITNAGDLVYIEEAGGYTARRVAAVSSGLLQMDAVAERTNGNLIVVTSTGKDNHSQANPTWTDIIGDPARILATFPDGVEGQWIPAIPNGASQEYKLNRKGIASLGQLTTDNDGGTWVTSTFFDSAIGVTNSRTTAGLTIGSVWLLHYQTQAHFTEDDVNSEVLDLGGVYALSGGFASFNESLILPSSLLGVVLEESGSDTRRDETYIDYARIKPNDGTIEGPPRNRTIDLTELGGVAVKTLDYLSIENGVAKLNYAYKEMAYDVTWGDNDAFEIIDNQATQTDDNGNTVLYGTASFNTQFFIDGSNA